MKTQIFINCAMYGGTFYRIIENINKNKTFIQRENIRMNVHI